MYKTSKDLEDSLYIAPNEIRACCKRFFYKDKMRGDAKLLDIIDGKTPTAEDLVKGRQKLFELRSGLSEGAEEFGDYNRKVEEYYNLMSQRNNLDLFKGLGDIADTSQEFESVNNRIKTAEI